MPTGVIRLKSIIIMVAVLVPAIASHVPSGHADYVNPAITDSGSPIYWIDKGGLFSAYGNYPAAAQAFRKALDLDMSSAEAHFGLGVAQGAMGRFADALESMSQAIALAPEIGRYHYGRGWVLMLAERRAEAMHAIRKARDMGDRDARLYLQHMENDR